MDTYALEIEEGIKDRLSAPYIFRQLKIGHYLYRLRDLVDNNSDQSIADTIFRINLYMENFISEVIFDAASSFQETAEGNNVKIGPFVFTNTKIRAESLTTEQLPNFLSFSDAYICAASLLDTSNESIDINAFDLLSFSALALYSELSAVIDESDSLPLFHDIDDREYKDAISRKNFSFTEALIDFVRILDEADRIEGSHDREVSSDDLPMAYKGKIAADARFDPARKLAREIAKDWVDKGAKPGTAAKEIQRTIAADPHALGLQASPTVQTIVGWISNLFPEELKTRGRPRKI